MSLFESTFLNVCKPQSKLDLPTLHQSSRERKNATNYIYIYMYIYTYIMYIPLHTDEGPGVPEKYLFQLVLIKVD